MYSWSPHFKYVVQTLEGGSKEESIKREEMLRNKVKAVVSCDIIKEEFIERTYCNKNSYDIVMSSLCLEAGCKDLDSYEHGIKKLASLIRVGGYLLLCSTRRESCEEGFYIVNNVKYYNISLRKDFITVVLQRNGLFVVDEDYLPIPPKDCTNSEGVLFFAAQKA